MKKLRISYLQSLNVLCRRLRRHMMVLKQKDIPKNLGLDQDPEPDWIRFQKESRSGSGCSKYLDPDPDSVNTDPKHCK
jgi:hypothetical protein